MTLRSATGTLRTATGTLAGQQTTRPRSAFTSAVVAATSSSSEFPWLMPSRTTMAASSRHVHAYFHTIPIYPIRSGGNNYGSWLTPASEPSTGGKWRQRPSPIIEGTLTNDLRITYAKEDIGVAARIGIDGFSMNILGGMAAGGSEEWRWTEHILPYFDAAAQFSQAEQPGFDMSPNLSMNSISASGRTAESWADRVKELLVHPAAYKRGGRPVVWFYNVDAIAAPGQWYRDFRNQLVNVHGINPYMIPAHQATLPTSNGNLDNYLALFQDGVFSALQPWTSPSYSTAVADYYTEWRAWCATNNVPFVGAAGPTWQNDRPEPPVAGQANMKHKEGKGLTILQNSWKSSINNLSTDFMFKVISWSDHIEAHSIRPSTGQQYAPYDVTAYYLAWYKTGSAPAILRDAIYYAHRMHKYKKADNVTLEMDATKQTAGPFNITSGPPLDQVLTTVFLKATADVIVTIGGVDIVHANVPAGVSSFADAMAAPDTPSFRVVRGGVTTAAVTSAFPTRTGIEWQDLAYRMGSSTRAPVPAVQSDLPQDRD